MMGRAHLVATLALLLPQPGKVQEPPTLAPGDACGAERFVYLWMPQDERAAFSRPLLCFALAHSRTGPSPSSDGGAPTCARFGDLCGVKTAPGPSGLDLYPPGSRLEAWWQHTGETWPIRRKGQIVTGTVASSSRLHQSHTGRVHGHIDIAFDPELDDEGADAREVHRVKLGQGVRQQTLSPLCPTLALTSFQRIASPVS
jgi:hypothetical protein